MVEPKVKSILNEAGATSPRREAESIAPFTAEWPAREMLFPMVLPDLRAFQALFTVMPPTSNDLVFSFLPLGYEDGSTNHRNWWLTPSDYGWLESLRNYMPPEEIFFGPGSDVALLLTREDHSVVAARSRPMLESFLDELPEELADPSAYLACLREDAERYGDDVSWVEDALEHVYGKSVAQELLRTAGWP